MSASLSIHGIENTIDQGGGGLVWNRLHSEREDVCQALLQEAAKGLHTPAEGQQESTTYSENWHRELLQSRLRKIDDALDRLMAGSYGSCSKCGRWIEDSTLDFDPAIAFCIDCWRRLQTTH